MKVLIATVLLLGNASLAAAQEDGFFANTKKQGRAAVEYRDAEIHVVAAYYYSQQNHDSRWLLIQVAMSTTRNLTFDRKDITIVAPGGRAVALSSQEQFAADVNRVRALVQNAAVTRHNTLSYFSERSRPERMRLFALDSGPVLTNFVTDEHHVAVGDFYFASPTGRWDNGIYSLVIEKDDARAVLPIELQ
jgi:predicted cupin superfamily sugar epimerase